MGKPTRVTNRMRVLRFAAGEMTQKELADRVRRRLAGQDTLRRAMLDRLDTAQVADDRINIVIRDTRITPPRHGRGPATRVST